MSAVPQSKLAITFAGEAHRPGEHPVRARRPVPGLAEDALRLAAEEPRPRDVVTADVHQPAALDLGLEADVALVVQRVAERRADEAELADRASVDELLQPLRSADCGAT